MDEPEEPPLGPTAGTLAGVPVPGFTIPCPGPLAAVLSAQATISADELCRLLPIGDAELRKHIRAGHISYLAVGFGRERTRWRFTLEHIMRFLEARSVTECQSTSLRGRPFTSTISSGAGSGFLARLERQGKGQRKR